MPDPQQQSQAPDYSNIQLDMSKAQPVSTPVAAPDYSNIQLDMTKAQPVAASPSQSPYQQEPISGVDAALDAVLGPGASVVKHAVTGPGTFLGTETPQPLKQEGSGVSDIFHGNIRQGLGKIVGAETWHVIPGSPIEKVIQRFDPNFHGAYTPEMQAEAERTNALTKPIIDTAQFIDKQKHPVLKAAAEAAQSLTTPENIAILAGTGGFGMVESPQALGVANRLLSTGFTAQAIAQAYQHFKSFKEAYNNGDANEAVYQMTHAVLSGAMATTAGMHAAGKEMPFASEFDKKIAGKAVDAIGNISTKASDAISTALGISQSFDTVIKNISKPSAKQYAAYKEKIANVSQDLQSILNNSKQPIEEPKQFANAIDTHIQTREADLQREAGETKDSNTPVAPDVQKRISDRLDTFFDEHKGFYGDDTDVAAAKAKILGRILQTRNGEHLQEPNLFEAENVRRGLNEDARPQFATNATPTTNAYKAGALEAANELRTAIDESFEKKGVRGVQEWRRKEADLIDIRDRIEQAQKKAEDMGQPGLWKAITGKIGAPSTIIAAAFGHLPGIGLAAAGVGADYIHQQATNPNALVERAGKLAARNPDATAIEPVRVPFAQEGPSVAPVSVQPVPTLDQPAPPAQAVPPAPVPPNPRENTPIHADLMTHYSESPGETPYTDLENRFLDDIRIKKENRVSLEPAEKTLLGKINQAKVKEILDVKRQAEKAQKEAAQKIAKGDFSDVQLDMTKAQPVTSQEQSKAEDNKAGLKEPTKLESAIEDKEEIQPVGSNVVEANQAIQKTPPEHMVTGMTEENVQHHEYGHVTEAARQGIKAHEFISSLHPRIENNQTSRSPGGVTWLEHPYIADDDTSKYTPEEIAENTMKWLHVYLAGGAANEVLDGIDPKTNKGLAGDMRQAKNILMLHDITGADADEIIRQVYDDVKQHLTRPEVQASIKTNAQAREENLPQTLHASAGRLENFQNHIRGLNEKFDNQGSNEGTRSRSEETQGARPGEKPARQAGPAQAPRPREELKTKNDIASAANEFNRQNGRAAVNPEPIEHRPETAIRIADAYDLMKHSPDDPQVQRSYQAAKKDIDKQFDFATDKMGLKLEPWTHEGQPYANSKEMTQDVKNNKHLYFFTGGEMPEGHPLAEIDPKTGLTYNDKLRAVHDLFGHAAHEFQFGPKGEEQAWNVHRQMFSPEAIPAITSETRGQNSWVNFGRHLRTPEGTIPVKNEPGYIAPPDRPYAQQKAGLLPEEFHQPNISDFERIKPSKISEGGKDFHEQNFPKSYEVEIKWPDGDTHLDEIKGLNRGHALSRAKGNWPDAENIRVLRETTDLHQSAQNLSRLQQASEPAGAKDVLERLQEQFKPTTDVMRLRSGATFLTPDGKIIPIGMADHRAIIHRMGYNADTLDDRVPFLNESGAVRTNFRVGRQGPMLVVSVPREGITSGQIDLIKQAIHPLLGRTGNLMIETADTPSQVRSEEKEFASAKDVEPMLRKIQAHPDQHQISQLQQDKESWQDQVARRMNDEPAGGIDPRTGKSDTEGIGTEIYPEAQQKLDHQPTSADIEKFHQDNKQIFDKHPELKVGWSHEPDGWELNIGAVGPGAVDVARKLDQRAAFDIGKQKEIPTGGTGGQKSFPDYALEQRLDELKQNPLKGLPKPIRESDYLTYPEKEILASKDSILNNFKETQKKIASSADLAQTMKAGEANRFWYDRARKSFGAMFDALPDGSYLPADRRIFPGIVAATSPQVDPAINLRQALDTYKAWLDAGRPSTVEEIRKVTDPILKLGAYQANAARALTEQPLSGPKVTSFAKNLRPEGEQNVTNDMWGAITNGLVEPKDLSKPGAYIALSHNYRKAAESLGWTPEQGQAASWGFVRTLGYASGWKGSQDFKPPAEVVKLIDNPLVRKYSADMAEIFLTDDEVRDRMKALGVDLEKFDDNLTEQIKELGRGGEGKIEGINPASLARTADRVNRAKQYQREQNEQGKRISGKMGNLMQGGLEGLNPERK